MQAADAGFFSRAAQEAWKDGLSGDGHLALPRRKP
jgi:hypothetical protein